MKMSVRSTQLADEMSEVRRIVILQCEGPVKDKFSIMPRRCFLTGKSLFMKSAVRTTRYLNGCQNPISNSLFEQHFWVDKDQYLLFQLRGN